MFSFKKKYFLFIENIIEFNPYLVKKRDKFVVIYRNRKNKSDLIKLLKFRKKCKEKGILFFVANDLKLLTKLQSDGLYISAFNKNLSLNKVKDNYLIIGSAHNYKEIYLKKKQKCSTIIFSRLFKTDYKYKKSYLGLVRFNMLINQFRIDLVPLGGIRVHNLNKLKIVNSSSAAILTSIKKKPAKIINRLF